MVQSMGIASFTRSSFHSIDTRLFSSLTENHELKSLLANADKVLMFFVFCIL